MGPKVGWTTVNFADRIRRYMPDSFVSWEEKMDPFACRRAISVAGNEMCSGSSDDQWHRIAGVLFRKFDGFLLFGRQQGLLLRFPIGFLVLGHIDDLLISSKDCA
jgi:hypothetical protein